MNPAAYAEAINEAGGADISSVITSRMHELPITEAEDVMRSFYRGREAIEAAAGRDTDEADEEWLKQGILVHRCQPVFSFNDDEVKDVLTPIIYISSRIRVDESTGFERGDVIGEGLIFVAGIALFEPEGFLVSDDFTALHDSFSHGSEAAAAAAASSPSGTLFIAWSEQKRLHVLVRNAISNL